ncbi:TPA: putative phage tail assembly chaperone [Citrobacter amalonaticus]|mgnify:CR=1 FL=1|uniref:putative phage tail assembly chaperone n=1 Tax=Citrobacter TaxID=544 RepID=UPI0019045C1D|nr:putative phage tail assembly chaperone [Citrobacter amalonaticus]EKW3843781.1 putative phage tail assembly chaperone [Citrobacter amalonaticus]MBJ9075573.1 putative phage tail assembly chaperone [Citrobacter amalonaticus]
MEKINLVVCEKEITFEPNQTAYNKFINEMAMDNKVAPAHNYLVRIVSAESKEALDDILKRPGAAIQLAGKVNELYAPELEIEVKN